MTWFSDAGVVTHTVTVEQSNLLYRALDAFGATIPDGPRRAQVDRLAAQIGQDNADAHNHARGERTLRAVQADPDATRALLAALPDPDDESFDRIVPVDVDEGDEAA